MTALVSVGLTAPADGVFSIAVHPTLFRLDRAAIEQSRARALGLDIDIKLGSMHMHLGWSALSMSGTSECGRGGPILKPPDSRSVPQQSAARRHDRDDLAG